MSGERGANKFNATQTALNLREAKEGVWERKLQDCYKDCQLKYPEIAPIHSKLL